VVIVRRVGGPDNTNFLDVLHRHDSTGGGGWKLEPAHNQHTWLGEHGSDRVKLLSQRRSGTKQADV